MSRDELKKLLRTQYPGLYAQVTNKDKPISTSILLGNKFRIFTICRKCAPHIACIEVPFEEEHFFTQQRWCDICGGIIEARRIRFNTNTARITLFEEEFRALISVCRERRRQEEEGGNP